MFTATCFINFEEGFNKIMNYKTFENGFAVLLFAMVKFILFLFYFFNFWGTERHATQT